jgi:hypothetical protein
MNNGDRTHVEALGDSPSFPRWRQTPHLAAPERSLDEQSRRLDGLLRLAFDILGAPFLDMRVLDEAEQ